MLRVVAEAATDVLDPPPQQRPAFLEHVGLPLAGPGSAGALAVDQEPAPLPRLPVQVADPDAAELGGPGAGGGGVPPPGGHLRASRASGRRTPAGPAARAGPAGRSRRGAGAG